MSFKVFLLKVQNKPKLKLNHNIYLYHAMTHVEAVISTPKWCSCPLYRKKKCYDDSSMTGDPALYSASSSSVDRTRMVIQFNSHLKLRIFSSFLVLEFSYTVLPNYEFFCMWHHVVCRFVWLNKIILPFWLRDTLKRVLNLPQNTIMEYKAHQSSLKYDKLTWLGSTFNHHRHKTCLLTIRHLLLKAYYYYNKGCQK